MENQEKILYLDVLLLDNRGKKEKVMKDRSDQPKKQESQKENKKHIKNKRNEACWGEEKTKEKR